MRRMCLFLIFFFLVLPVVSLARQGTATSIRVSEPRLPKKVKHVQPVYPERARQARIQGLVGVEITIGTDGRVSSARLATYIPMLGEAALDAVKQWVYDPATIKAPVTLNVSMYFAVGPADSAVAPPAAAGPPPASSAAGGTRAPTTPVTTLRGFTVDVPADWQRYETGGSQHAGSSDGKAWVEIADDSGSGTVQSILTASEPNLQSIAHREVRIFYQRSGRPGGFVIYVQLNNSVTMINCQEMEGAENGPGGCLSIAKTARFVKRSSAGAARGRPAPPSAPARAPSTTGGDVPSGTAPTTTAAPGAAATTPADIGGVYTGSYVCSERQISLQLSLEAKATSHLSGVFTFYTPGSDPSQPLGAFRVDGSYDPATGAFRLEPTSWIKAAPGYMTVALSGTYDAASGRLKGMIRAPGCLPFELARDEAATRRAAEQAAAHDKQLADAPTSLSQARNPAEQCLVLAKWYSRFKKEYPDTDIMRSMADQIQTRAMNLFLNEEFVPVFGKPFDRMQDGERKQVMMLVRTCANGQTDRGDHSMYQDTLQRPFMASADAISRLAYRRSLRQQKERLLQELPSLAADGQSMQRVAALRDTELKAYEALWPSEYRALTQAVQSAAARLAAPALNAWVNTVMAGASGHQGLASVMEARRRLAAARPSPSESFLADASPESRAAADARLRAHAEALVTQLVAEERSQLSTLGSGAEALQAGTAWYGRFNAAFAEFQSNPSVRDTLAAFEARRKQDRAAGADTVLARVKEAQTAPQVAALIAAHLGVPSDRSDPVGARILSAAAARETALATAAARAEVEARSVTNFCKKLKTDDGSRETGEPSSRDMCMALADQYDAVNETIRERKAACEGGDYRNNPTLAMQCLGLCAGTSGNCEVSFSLTRFQKIACEKAQGKPGFVCDFVVGFSASNPAMQQMIASVGGSGSMTQGRFVKAAGGWIKLPE